MAEMESLVKGMVEKFKTRDLDVLYAKCSGFPNPTEIQGAEPDVVAWDPSKELYHLGLVAGSSDGFSDDFVKKTRVLASMMMSTGTSEGKRLPFYLGFTKESANDLEENLQKIDPKSKENIEKLEI